MPIIHQVLNVTVAFDLWEPYVAGLAEEDRTLLTRVRDAMGLAADVSRSDVMLLIPGQAYGICVAVHARPHSMASLYDDAVAGVCYPASERRWLWRTVYQGKRTQRLIDDMPDQRSQVSQQFWPVMGQQRPIAAVGVYTNAIERERHRRRDSAFQRALAQFLRMLSQGVTVGSDKIPPFTEQDGIIFVDHAGRYRYLSGQASNAYRRLGYLDDLRGRALKEVGAGDWRIVKQAWNERRCVFSEDTVQERILLRSAIPLFGNPQRWLSEKFFGKLSDGNRYGALLLIKDETESRHKARQLKVKAMLLKEVHHRVKNNLQMLISITSMQARRAQTEEARQLLHDTTNRIMSIAVIHEALSLGEDQILDLRAVIERVISQVQAGVLQPQGQVHIVLAQADPVMLPTAKATVCALVLNELLLNALEHGFDTHTTGRIEVQLADRDGIIELAVSDNGRGLPSQFSLDQKSSLGLDIISTLVQEDLRGTFELIPQIGAGTQAIVRFPRYT